MTSRTRLTHSDPVIVADVQQRAAVGGRAAMGMAAVEMSNLVSSRLGLESYDCGRNWFFDAVHFRGR